MAPEAGSSGVGGWVSHLGTAILSGIVGAIITWWIRGNEAHGAELAACIDDVVDELAVIEKTATKYWSEISDVKTSDALCPGQILSEQHEAATNSVAAMVILEGHLHRLAKLMDFAGKKVPAFGTYGCEVQLQDLRIACTHDGLRGEDASLASGPYRVKTIMVRSTSLLLTLRAIRRDVLPRDFFRRIKKAILTPHSPEPDNRRNYWSVD